MEVNFIKLFSNFELCNTLVLQILNKIKHNNNTEGFCRWTRYTVWNIFINILYFDSRIVCVIGNKTDREDREIPSQVGEDFAQRHNMYYLETSAKEAENVERLFMQIAAELMEVLTLSYCVIKTSYSELKVSLFRNYLR